MSMLKRFFKSLEFAIRMKRVARAYADRPDRMREALLAVVHAEAGGVAAGEDVAEVESQPLAA